MNAETMAEAMFPESETTYDYQAVREAFEYGFAAAQQCLPTVEEIEQAILSARSPVSYEVVASSAAVQVLALFAAQPTVREAKAEGWAEGLNAGLEWSNDDFRDALPSNPYRSEADHG